MPNVKKGLMGAAGAGVAGDQLYTWGAGTLAQLPEGAGTKVSRSSPIQITGPGSAPGTTGVTGARPWTNASLSGFVISEGNMYAWGHQTNGILANNGATTSGPTYAPPFTQIVGDQAWANLSNGCDRSTMHATKQNGTLWAWGDATNGMLGDGTTVTKSSVVQVGSLTDWGTTCKIRGSNNMVFALKPDGTLWGWGQNRFGALGVNVDPAVTYSFSSPVQVATGVADFGVARYRAAMIKTDGKLFSWGLNNQGQVGTNNTTTYSSPVQIGSLTTWAKIELTQNGASVIKTDGTFWAWGTGTDGYSPWGNTTTYSSPIQVGSLTDWAVPDALTGGGSGFCTKTDGTLWAFGRNYVDIFQTGTATSKFSSPIQVGTNTHYFAPNVFFGGGGGQVLGMLKAAG
jgi:alpha-tubulin suppressor-like RCC1 family protein